MSSLGRCLHPGNMVVVGGRHVAESVRESRKFGYEGEIWVVNPRQEELAGLTCYGRVADLPAVPDSAFVAVPAEATIEVVGELAAMGCGGAVCYASGFLEVGSDDRHQRLIAAAGTMPIIGPNCYGMLNAVNGAVLWPSYHGLRRVERGVAIFTGSGNVSVNMTMQNRSVPIALLVTIGNQVTVGIEQLILAALEDDKITAIGVHIEGLKNVPLFIEAARRAAEVGKPIVALKTGRSDAGARIALSHTATLAGSADLYDHLFQRVGVGVVHDIESFLETLRLLSVTGPLAGCQIASMSCSGGEASLIADLCQDTPLSFPDFSEGGKRALTNTLNEFVDISNPLDYHTFIWGDRERLRQTFAAVLADGFDMTLLLLDTPSIPAGELNEWMDAAEGFIDACVDTGRPGAVVASLAENMPLELRERLLAHRVVPMLGLPQAIAALSAAAMMGQQEGPLPQVIPGTAVTDRHTIAEFEAKQLLGASGLPTTRAELVTSVVDAEAAAGDLGYPVVLKASVTGLAHKTEASAVVLDVKTPEVLREESARLLGLGGQLLVEEMIPAGVAELLLGVSYDEQFGHYLVLGCGGTLVEIMADRALLMLPVSDEQIGQALEGLRIAPVLNGYRGRPAADRAALIACVRKLADFVAERREELLEVDINPLIVGPGGATVADALIVFRGVAPEQSKREEEQ